jgi:hypothetical protein
MGASVALSHRYRSWRYDTPCMLEDGTMPTLKELLLSFLESVENLAIENVKLKVIIQGLPMAESPGFSLENLIRETQLVGDSEAYCRNVYAEARRAIQQRSDPELALTKLLEQFPKHGKPH